MNCREFTIEFEDRADLSEAATLHLKICAECVKTSERQTRIWLTIDELPRVDAPKNFDFSVKARIANAKPSDFQPRLLPILRYVLPLSVIVLVLGLFAFNTSFFFGGNAVPPVAEIIPAKPSTAETSPDTASSIENFNAAESPVPSFTDENITTAASIEKPQFSGKRREAQFVAVKSDRRAVSNSPRRILKDDSNEVRSRDTSLTQPRPTLFPENLNPNKKIETIPDNVTANSLTDEKIWSFIGIEIVRENDRRKVKTIAPKSYAERAGVRVGDVIEAIDGVKLSAEPLRVNTFEGKKLTVARGRETVEITLENKPNQ